MASFFEKCANVLLMAACAVVVGEFAYRHVNRSNTIPRLFNAGQLIKAKPSLNLPSASRTLIIATSSTCPYCLASMPVYRNVADAARRVGAQVVAVCGEAPDVNRAYLASNGISVDRALSQPDSGVQVPQVPSLILVGRDGTVVDSWTGQADSAIEKSALKALGR
jgi:thiol-disulfide isomerase/thioredoxin